MTAALILWIVLVLFCLLVTFISAILACCLKERKKIYAVDSLLISATLLIAITLSINFFLSDIKKTASHAKQTKALKQCDAAVDSIGETGYVKELSEPARTIVNALSSNKIEKELEKAEGAVQKQADDFPDNSDIHARLAIILHAEGKDTAPLLEHFRRVGGRPSPLLKTIQILYGMPDTKALDSSNALDSSKSVTNSDTKNSDASDSNSANPLTSNSNASNSNTSNADVKSNESIQNATGSKAFAEILKRRLPQGWYQQTALIDLYKKYDPVELKSALAAQHEDSEAWRFRIQSFLVVDAILIILGLASIAIFTRLKKGTTPEFIPMTTDFRRMYACLISTIFAQVIVAGAIGFWIGFSSVLSHKPVDPADYEASMSTALILAGAIFCILLVYFLILKPQALSFKAAFTRSAAKLKPAEFAMYCLGGFAAGNVLIFVSRMIYQLVPGAGRSTNPAHIEMVKAFTTGNLEMIFKSVTFACLIAPFTEEIMFRGLLFGWLRSKFGFIPAMFGSSVLFALWHLDPNGFVQYFSLGVVLSIVYNRTRNLWISMLIHGLWNFWVVSTVYWVTSYHR